MSDPKYHQCSRCGETRMASEMSWDWRSKKPRSYCKQCSPRTTAKEKTCTSCGVSKPICSSFNMTRRKDLKCYKDTCKACDAIARANKVTPPLPVCTCCGQSKMVQEFGRTTKMGKTVRQAVCKVCRAEADRKKVAPTPQQPQKIYRHPWEALGENERPNWARSDYCPVPEDKQLRARY